MSIENITANILESAKKGAEDSIKNAEQNAEEIISKAKLEAESIKKSAEEKAQKDAEIIKSRKVSAAELQGKKMMLSSKQDAIKQSFNASLEKLKQMPEEKYIKYLTDEIIKVPQNIINEGLIILNKKDKESIGGKLVKAVNEKLKTDKFTLSNETINSSGGFVLKSGNIEINSTFEAILDSMKDELTNEVANALFK